MRGEQAIIIICVLLTAGLFVFYLATRHHRAVLTPSSCPDVTRIITKTPMSTILNLPPRRMWGWGAEYSGGAQPDPMVGYCGECAVQTTLIYYGNWVSQEQIYKNAGNNTFIPGLDSDLLFTNLQMNTDFWPNDPKVTFDQITAYIKSQVDLGYPMVVGFYINEAGGDPSFDHITPVFGYKLGSNGKVDTIYFNDAYQMFTMPMDCTLDATGKPKCYQKRNSFNDPNNIAVAPYQNAIPDVTASDNNGTPCMDGNNPCSNAIIAIQGNMDPNDELYDAMLIMDSAFEPNWGNEDQLGVSVLPLGAIVAIMGLDVGVKYSMLRFDNPADLPTAGGFLASGPWTLRVDFTASCETHRIRVDHEPLTYPFMSDGTYFFRVVKNTAPTKSKYSLGTDRTDHTPGTLIKPPLSAALINMTNASGKPAFIGERTHMREKKTRRNNSPDESGKINNHEFDATVVCTNGPTVNPAIKCGNLGVGSIHPNWEWTFPNSRTYGVEVPKLGCFPVTFTMASNTTQEQEPTCLAANITTGGGQFGTITVDATIGLDGRMYVEDYDSFQFFAYSPNGPNTDGSYTMLSQDGITYSIIRPV